ncbi:MAG: TPR domain protein, partial [Deltaproteobacteria bacterium]|nr:TPR domain protein [Deltaproteobacteria bacterium]
YHRALAHLLIGDYATGWVDYELRLISEDRPRCDGDFPRWDGSSLTGRMLLVRGEQGLGDEIMFASCLPEVIARSRRCIVECSPRLEKLYCRSFPGADVVASTPDHVLPAAVTREAVDFEIPVASLPRHLRRSAGEFPSHRGYLKADPQRVAFWRKRLSQLGPGPKVGISWRGGTHKTRSPLRSLPLEHWLPILGTPGVNFFSVQYGDVVTDLSALEARDGFRVAHWREAIDDYDETAALWVGDRFFGRLAGFAGWPKFRRSTGQLEGGLGRDDSGRRKGRAAGDLRPARARSGDSL